MLLSTKTGQVQSNDYPGGYIKAEETSFVSAPGI